MDLQEIVNMKQGYIIIFFFVIITIFTFLLLHFCDPDRWILVKRAGLSSSRYKNGKNANVSDFSIKSKVILDQISYSSNISLVLTVILYIYLKYSNITQYLV